MALLILLLAAATRVEVADAVYTIPAAEWRYVPVEVSQTPAVVNCDFQVLTAGGEVRAALLSRADRERLRADQPHGFLTATPLETSGRLHYRLLQGGEYAIVVVNRAARAAVRVHLRVSLDSAGRPAQGVGRLSPQRQLAVILISFAVFFGIVTWSAAKLLKAIKG
jgi:hypothetical protein